MASDKDRTTPDPLNREARLFSTYLLGCDPAPEEVERYVRGSRILFPDPEGSDLAMVSFAVKHRWALPLLDGAAGLVHPDCLLRRKLILMLAVLETTLAHRTSFEPLTGSRAAIGARILLRAAAGTVKSAAGLVLLPLAKRHRP